MTDHNELAARIERAEGPDRALDELIHEASGLPFVMEYYTEYATEQTRNLSYVPRYTASIDAAMQLVPCSWKLRQMHFNAPCADDRKWHLNLRGGKEGGDRFVGRGSTPALALSAAALRARSAS